jgi:hypothetical protein
MPLSHREFIEALMEMEQEYASLRLSDSAHDRKIGQMAMFVLNKLKRKIKQKIIEKHGS